MKYDITLLTPTGGRPYQMRLSEIYKNRQKTKLNIQWIVIDDFKDTAQTDYDCDLVIVRKPFWKPGDKTLGQNILEGMKFIESDFVLFWEDDDWYHPDYIQFYYEQLQKCDLFGQGFARYYNVNSGGYRVWDNKRHASLCQTGMRTEKLLENANLFERLDCPFYDLQLWRARRIRKHIDVHSMPYCIGMKGMPGRGGLGAGHKDKYTTYDENRTVIKEWIGDDWKKYDIFFKENQHDRA
jgi:glycosyltransferase involved in cell wall biosynthesis